jgi:predicted nucleic acid-binding protein
LGETLIKRVVFLDNTVLTNFALIGHPDLIFSLWSGIACTTKQVMQEYQAGVKSSRLPVEAWGDLPVYELADAEMAKATELPSQLGAGERTCLAAAVQRQGIFASDDQQARKYALQIGLAVIGSIGILVRCVKKGLISQAHAQALLDRMIAENYHSPISNLDEILD